MSKMKKTNKKPDLNADSLVNQVTVVDFTQAKNVAQPQVDPQSPPPGYEQVAKDQNGKVRTSKLKQVLFDLFARPIRFHIRHTAEVSDYVEEQIDALGEDGGIIDTTDSLPNRYPYLMATIAMIITGFLLIAGVVLVNYKSVPKPT